MRRHGEETFEKHPELRARDQKAARRACRCPGIRRTAITSGGHAAAGLPAKKRCRDWLRPVLTIQAGNGSFRRPLRVPCALSVRPLMA